MTPQELKNSILQLAIQGRLVEQRPEEGTAEELYKKLKKHHIGLKVCKDELDYSSMDFDIPDSWKMVELNQLFNFVDYRGMTPNKITEGIFLITASNIKNGYMDYTRKEYISIEEYEKRKSRGVTNKGDLLFTTEAPMGNAAVCDLDVCSCGQRIITFQYYEENTIIPSLYMYFILSLQFQKQLLNNCTGTTAKGIKADKLKHFLIPLPPLAEQKRIVAKIEELLPLIDRYEKAWTRLEDFNKRFPDDMQKSILQMAIQGKLVEQRPEEGTAEELYNKLKKHHIGLKACKDELDYSSMDFDIPDTWKMVELNQLFNFVDYRGMTPNKITEGIFLITASNIKNGYMDYTREEYISLDEYEKRKSRGVTKKGDLLFTTEAPMGNAAICDLDVCSCGQRIITFQHYEENTVIPSLFMYFILTPQFQKQLLDNCTGTTAKGIKADKLKHFLIPLPPLAEQKRIVAKIEELLPLCERLKKD